MKVPAPLSAVPQLAERVFAVDGPEAFNALALDLFRFHAGHNPVYRGFLAGARLEPTAVNNVLSIPCLPLSLFRNHTVLLEGLEAQLTFTSSGTTGSTTSHHHVPWPELYERSFLTGFHAVYGDPREWRILGLLPAYLERTGSSLVYMAEKLIAASNDPFSGTYLYKYDDLAQVLSRTETERKKTLLIGVPFALLDLADRHPMPLRHTTIIETGGMKGRRPELVRDELHSILKTAFQAPLIHGEYGMTELLSQAWSTGNGTYRCPPWMKVRVRDVNDPFHTVPNGRTGGIDVIDLANIGSCPFISTQDLGRMHDDGSFEVLGRFDHSDARGCNLLVEQ